ncbi:hypothetical protein Tco_0401411 [Tanacetum coccineum]
MACSVPHTYDEIKAMVEKQIEEDTVRQLAIMNLAVEYDNASTAKNDLRKAYEEYNDISQEKRALIDTFLKEESDKNYEMHNAFFRKLSTTCVQPRDLSWIRLPNFYGSQHVFAFRILFLQSLFCMIFFVKQLAYDDDSFLTICGRQQLIFGYVCESCV